MTSPLELHGPLPAGRQGWRRGLIELITPAVRLAALGPDRQPAAASVNDPRATWWELVTRPLWGLAALTAGNEVGGDVDTTADRSAGLWASLRQTICQAVDPAHGWYIGPPDSREQRLVESAAVGYALTLASRKLWEPLNSSQQRHLGSWLAAASAAEPVDNNWHFFPVLAGRGLDAVGFTRDRSTDAAHLSRIDEFYRAGGWYEDGPTDRYDYYNPFGFHFYNVLLGRRLDELAQFADGFQYWFAADGSSIPFGRSLGYRMAQGAFWGALAYAGLEALPWSRIRGLAQRHLEWWWRQPILGGDGLLSVGYRYPNSGIVEQYIGAGSPYWATKFFLPLALPADHPFWTAEPEAGEDGLARLPGGIVQRHRGEAVLLNGQGRCGWARAGQAKYAKFAYSTRSGFSVGVGEHCLEHGAFDNMLALTDDDGDHWRARETIAESRVDDDTVYSRWLPWPDVQVETWLIPHGQWHLRVHRLRTARALRSAEGGFCQPLPPAGQDCAETADAVWRGIQDAGGDRDPLLVEPIAGTNVLHPRTVLPMLLGRHEPGEHLLTCAVYHGDPRDDDMVWPAPDLESVCGSRWTITPWAASQGRV